MTRSVWYRRRLGAFSRFRTSFPSSRLVFRGSADSSSGRTAQLPADHIPPAPKKQKSHLTPHPHVTHITLQTRRKRIVSDSGFPTLVSRCRWQCFFVSRGASTNGDFMSIRSLRSYLLLLLFTSYFRIYCISWVYWLLLMCRAHKPANSCHLHVNLTVPQNEFQTKTKCFQN